MKSTDQSMTRREALFWIALPFPTAMSPGFTRGQVNAAEGSDPTPGDRPHANDPHIHQGGTMEVYYHEIVTTDVDATCSLWIAAVTVADGF